MFFGCGIKKFRGVCIKLQWRLYLSSAENSGNKRIVPGTIFELPIPGVAVNYLLGKKNIITGKQSEVQNVLQQS